jgi:hypothetical protein
MNILDIFKRSPKPTFDQPVTSQPVKKNDDVRDYIQAINDQLLAKINLLEDEIRRLQYQQRVREKKKRKTTPAEKELNWEAISDNSVLCYYNLDPNCFSLDASGNVTVTGGSGGLSAVSHDSTLLGDGTSTSELKVASPFSPSDYTVKSLVAGSNITLSNSSGAWTINSTGGGSGGMDKVYHDATLTGDGTSSTNQLGVVYPFDPSTYTVKSLVAGSNISLTDTDGAWTIDNVPVFPIVQEGSGNYDGHKVTFDVLKDSDYDGMTGMPNVSLSLGREYPYGGDTTYWDGWIFDDNCIKWRTVISDGTDSTVSDHILIGDIENRKKIIIQGTSTYDTQSAQLTNYGLYLSNSRPNVRPCNVVDIASGIMDDQSGHILMGRLAANNLFTVGTTIEEAFLYLNTHGGYHSDDYGFKYICYASSSDEFFYRIGTAVNNSGGVNYPIFQIKRESSDATSGLYTSCNINESSIAFTSNLLSGDNRYTMLDRVGLISYEKSGQLGVIIMSEEAGKVEVFAPNNANNKASIVWDSIKLYKNGTNTSYRQITSADVLSISADVPALRDFSTTDFLMPYSTGNTSGKICLADPFNSANYYDKVTSDGKYLATVPAAYTVKSITANGTVSVVNNSGACTITGSIVTDSSLTGAGITGNTLKVAAPFNSSLYYNKTESDARYLQTVTASTSQFTGTGKSGSALTLKNTDISDTHVTFMNQNYTSADENFYMSVENVNNSGKITLETNASIGITGAVGYSVVHAYANKNNPVCGGNRILSNIANIDYNGNDDWGNCIEVPCVSDFDEEYFRFGDNHKIQATAVRQWSHWLQTTSISAGSSVSVTINGIPAGSLIVGAWMTGTPAGVISFDESDFDGWQTKKSTIHLSVYNYSNTTITAGKYILISYS